MTPEEVIEAKAEEAIEQGWGVETSFTKFVGWMSEAANALGSEEEMENYGYEKAFVKYNEFVERNEQED